MSKILCLFSLGLSVLLAILFILDMSIGIPFKKGSIVFDVVFLIAAVVIGVLSWFTYREQ